MNGGQGALQPSGRTQFRQRQVGLPVQQRPELVALGGHVAGLAPGTMLLRPKLADSPPLLEELLDHAQRHPETPRHLRPGSLLRVVGSQNPRPQIH